MARGRNAAGEPRQRQRRVGEIVREALAEALARGHFRDPLLDGARITVTEVRPAPDLRSARVYVMPLGGERAGDLIDALQRAAGYLRGEVNRRVALKFSPALRFELDGSFDRVQRIETLLDTGDGSRG